ncbi:hypothetical protein MVEN_01145800 [Mycena venus]|uniref:Uncharacterized protein n=1 Tax=Mycena venus TaxID=2733690 RepID=A0A8H6Y4K4_9AGAR|nr:hypothetical protein MVEN_01145800 [Mycena venus]
MTSANRNLLAKNTKTDPPLLFAKLSSGGHRHATESEHEDSIVHVNFYDKLDHKKSLRQVIVDDLPVQLLTTTNGGKKYSALLSQLIPAAIRNDSPIKERNIRDDPQHHHHLGKIDALLDGSGHTVNPKKHERAGAMELKDDKMDGPKVFTGAGSDIPLDIANDRAAHDPMHKNTSAAQRERFAKFVNGKTQEAMLDQHLLQEAAMKFMDDQKWSLTHGGFKVPRGSTEYPGIQFKKDFLLEEALTIKDVEYHRHRQVLHSRNAPECARCSCVG